MARGKRIDPALPPGVDYSKVFLTYVSLLGNSHSTAQATGLTEEQVRLVAERDNWNAKVKSLLSVKEKEGAEAFARELNRTANFVQAITARNLLDQAVKHLCSGQTLDGFLHTTGATGVRNVSVKALLDLVKSMETVQRMTYAALGDTAADRRNQDDSPAAGDNPSMSMVRALAALADGSKDPNVEAQAHPAQLEDETDPS